MKHLSPVLGMLVLLGATLSLLVGRVGGLDNGLARTPPMGWMSWERFACNVDCKTYPDDCIGEKLIKSTADAMVKYGFKDAGYTYISIDDCWMAMKRDGQGRLQPNSTRFPSGIKSLADYVHSKGMKLGIYLDTGNATCQGYPGSQGHYDVDAQTIAAWGVDMLKFDGCNTKDPHAYDKDYPEMGKQLNKTGRPILYACEWPVYQSEHGLQPDFAAVAKSCNMFRTFKDIVDSWGSLEATIKYMGDQSKKLSNYTGPGAWNDPDQLLIGDFGLSLNQQKMQMALWCIMGAPLIVSADMRKMPPASAAILLNMRAISISQDPLGVMGVRKSTMGQVQIWMKPVKPDGSFALALIYTNISGGPSKVSVKLMDLGMHTAGSYNFTEVFDGRHIGLYKPWYTFNAEVNPTGVLFIKATAIP